MAEATKQVGPPTESGAGREPKWRDLGLWLVTLAWGTSAYIYGWLLIGGFEKREYWNREYWNQIYEVWSFANFWLPLICGIVVAVFSFFGTLAKKPAEGEGKQLFRIVVAVLPALFLVSALAVLTLTLATYNADWKDARQGIATAFAALIAAVGVVVSVAVSYRTGEENRLAQQENLKTQLESQQRNLETQLEHQRALEDEKGSREHQKLDAELIKNLNDRLHEIIPRRYGDKPEEVSASYFQLAALYKDWETLSATSQLIARQKESQQRNILKLLFGVYQESGDGESSKRSEVDIRTLNSVIQDIFPAYQENTDESVNVQEPALTSFDLSYLDLRGLDISMRDLQDANLVGAHLESANLRDARLEDVDLRDARLEGANLVRARLEGANLSRARLEGANLVRARLEGADLWGARLEGADLWGARLEGADLWGARLEGADLSRARLEGANLARARLEGADLRDAHLEGADLRGARLKDTSFFPNFENLQDIETRERNINYLKKAENLPTRDELLKAKDFEPALVDDIIKAHEEYHAKNNSS